MREPGEFFFFRARVYGGLSSLRAFCLGLLRTELNYSNLGQCEMMAAAVDGIVIKRTGAHSSDPVTLL